MGAGLVWVRVCVCAWFMAHLTRRQYCAGGRRMGAGLVWVGLVTSIGRQMSCRHSPRQSCQCPPCLLPIHPTPNPRHPRTEILFYIGSRK